ncbi:MULTISPECIES: hypothetical protein [Halomonadaceae]|uniref:hypothetical protein n=1 Tax=Halomonadaceae TaxID=28256 RepID=UPI00159B017C|nr:MULTISPECIES: hypothetical protein [Halomonas]QJQ95326.1 hypothetical protein HIO72_08615 [Halomonas sp. PA5]
MSNKPWIAASMMLALSLGLAGCGNGDDEPATQDVPAQEPPTQEAPAQDPASDPQATQQDPSLEQPAGTTAGDSGVNGAGQTPIGADDEAATANDLPAGTADAPVEPGERAVPADPDVETPQTREDDVPATIDDQTAMPGETSDSDIDEFLQETERRFEEAQRQIDEQFEEVESQEPGVAN